MSERRDGRGGGGGHQWRFDHEAACTTENVVVSVPQALSCEGSKPESVPGRRLPSPLISDGELEFNPDPAIIRHLPTSRAARDLPPPRHHGGHHLLPNR